ncbi:MAG: hypothetical protein WDA00_03375 [Eubacteriales bacterium]
MKYKADWESAKVRLAAFWEQEVVDRCCFEVTAPLEPHTDPTAPLEPRPANWRTDPDFLVRQYRGEFARTYYGGEAFPKTFINLGAAGHAGYFKGAKYEIHDDSVWFFPSAHTADDLVFDEESFLYQKTLELAEKFALDSRGDYIIGMPDGAGNADALAHLWGSQRLLEAMIEEPEEVQRALAKMQYAYEKEMLGAYEILKKHQIEETCIGWMGTYAARGLHAQMQSDLSVMISTDMYNEFIMPELERQCEILDYPLYHFDGIDQIRHLDSLLSIRKLRAIQWMQVAGQPRATDFIPVLRKIQQAGKGLFIMVRPHEVQPLMESLSSRGLYLSTKVSSPGEADELLQKVKGWTHE